MSPELDPLDAAIVVFVPLLRALEEAEAAVLHAHPALPLGDCPDPVQRDDLLASILLHLIDNLRVAARVYHRERHLARLPPQL
jgi:hypothetical protein